MVPQSVKDKAKALGIVPGAEVEWSGRFSNSGKFIVPPYDKWYDAGGGDYMWMQYDGAPNGECWIIGSDYYIPKVINTPKPVARFKVGDMVVCPRSHRDDHGNNPYWNPSMDECVGKPMRIDAQTRSRNWMMNNQWSFHEDWLIPYTEEDDVIRVGDTVERGPDWEWNDQDRRCRGVVQKDTEDGWFNVRWSHGGDNTYRWSKDGHKDIQKVKAGGPVSTTQKPSSHEQVQGASDIDSGRAEGRVVERPDAGRQGATGGRHPGKPASQPQSRFTGAKGTVRFTL